VSTLLRIRTLTWYEPHPQQSRAVTLLIHTYCVPHHTPHTRLLQDLARLSLTDPEYLAVHAEAEAATPVKLQQAVAIVEAHQKMDTLWSFIKAHLAAKTIVFLSTCKQVGGWAGDTAGTWQGLVRWIRRQIQCNLWQVWHQEVSSVPASPHLLHMYGLGVC
jgi:hypothetical protein